MPRDGDSDRRGIFRGRPARASRAVRRRGGSHRAAPRRGVVPRDRQDHRRGEKERRGGDPPRVRLPCREPPFRRPVRNGEDQADRPVGPRDADDGVQDRRPQDGAGGRRAGGPRNDRADLDRGGSAADREGDRVSGDVEGHRGRRRRMRLDRRRSSIPPSGWRSRGEVRLQRRLRLHRSTSSILSTSRSRSWAIGTATTSTCASASARSSAATRR